MMNALFGSGMGINVTIHAPASGLEDRYATTPLKIVLPKQQPVDEDSLHASFDAALSDRLLALNNHWNSYSSLHTSASTTETLLDLQPGISTEPLTACMSQSAYIWPQWVIYACLVLMLVMIGFDLMGLLVLNAH